MPHLIQPLEQKQTLEAHDDPIERSVARFLWELGRIYLLGTLTTDESQARLQQFIRAFKQEIDLGNEILKDALDYLEEEISTDPNALDLVNFTLTTDSGEKQEHACVMTLEETFGLVCAATMDVERYPNETLENSEKELAFRLETLCQTVITLHQKRVCHTGIRQDLAFALNGVFPKKEKSEERYFLIVYLQGFIFDYIKGAIESLLRERLITEPSKYRGIIKQWICEGEMPEEFFNDFADAKEQGGLLKPLHQLLAEQGIDPADIGVSQMINDYTEKAVLRDINPPLMNEPVLHLLSEIILLKPKQGQEKRNSILREVQRWIRETFDFDQADHQQFLSDFRLVDTIGCFLQENEAPRLSCNDGPVSTETIESIRTICQDYCEQCIQDASAIVIKEETAQQQLVKFNMPWIDELSAPLLTRIEQSFAGWFANSSKEGEATLYDTLIKPVLYQKIIFSNQVLDRLFPKTGKSIEIIPYLINRLFAQAIVQPSDQWREQDAKILSKVIEFVVNDFNHETPQGAAEAIKPEQQRYCYYSYRALTGGVSFFGELSKGESSTNSVQTPAHIRFLDILRELSPKTRASFIKNVDQRLLQDIVDTCSNLVYVLTRLLGAAQTTFIEKLDQDFLQGKIETSDELIDVILELSPENQASLIKMLSQEFLQGIVETSDKLTAVLRELLPEARTSLIKKLGQDFLQRKIDMTAELEEVLSELPAEIRAYFTEELGQEFPQDKIETLDGLITALLEISQENQIRFIKKLNKTALTKIIKSEDDFHQVIDQVRNLNKIEFIQLFPQDFFRRVIDEPRAYDELMKKFPPENFVDFITYFGSELFNRFFKSIILESKDPKFIIPFLEDHCIKVIQYLDKAALKEFLCHDDNMSCLLFLIPAKHRISFLHILDVDFIIEQNGLGRFPREWLSVLPAEPFVTKLREHFNTPKTEDTPRFFKPTGGQMDKAIQDPPVEDKTPTDLDKPREIPEPLGALSNPEKKKLRLKLTGTQQEWWSRLIKLYDLKSQQNEHYLQATLRQLAMEILEEQYDGPALEIRLKNELLKAFDDELERRGYLQEQKQIRSWGEDAVLLPLLYSLGYQPTIFMPYSYGISYDPFTLDEDEKTGLKIALETDAAFGQDHDDTTGTHWNLKGHETIGDGNCMYRAVAQQVLIDLDEVKQTLSAVMDNIANIYKAAEDGDFELLKVELETEHEKAERNIISGRVYNPSTFFMALLFYQNPDDGRTFLHEASSRGALEIVQQLLHRDADINAEDSMGKTPLDLAIQQGHEEVIKALLEKQPSFIPYEKSLECAGLKAHLGEKKFERICDMFAGVLAEPIRDEVLAEEIINMLTEAITEKVLAEARKPRPGECVLQ